MVQPTEPRGTYADAAEKMLQATTCWGMRTIRRQLMWQLRMRQEHLKYNLLDCQVYTDAFLPKSKDDTL
jgi:hypothetical protein